MPATSRSAERFNLAVAQRTRRFAFEIENDEIFASVKQLSQMIVAVNPDFRGVGAAIEQSFFARQYFLLCSEHFLRFISKCSRRGPAISSLEE